MIDALKQNVETEIEILREISNNLRRLDYSGPSERKLLLTSTESLKSSLKVINNSIPKLLDEISIVKKLPQKEQETNLERVEFKGSESVVKVTIPSEEREKLLHDLSISESLLKKIRKKAPIDLEKFSEMKAARGYVKLSNKFFLNYAQSLIAKGHFKPLSVELRRANIDVLFSAYVAMIIFSTVLAFISSFIIMIILFFVDINFSAPYISMASGDFYYYITEFTRIFWIPLVIPASVFLLLYYYPSTEKDSLAKKIDQELPFAVIHMSAISGSGIEPSQIFKIIMLNREYPFLRKEIRKVTNQINLYGYDLVTALGNVSKTTPSTRLAELFSGLSTNITSGGNLSDFFEKRSESLLMNYRLEREKYTKLAETFMDIYISIVIAAPMILMLLMIMISVANINTGYSANQMTAMIIFIIALVNGLFIVFLKLKQPAY